MKDEQFMTAVLNLYQGVESFRDGGDLGNPVSELFDLLRSAVEGDVLAERPVDLFGKRMQWHQSDIKGLAAERSQQKDDSDYKAHKMHRYS